MFKTKKYLSMILIAFMLISTISVMTATKVSAEDTSWFFNAKFGVFTHFLMHNRQNPTVTDINGWNTCVNNYDVNAFAKQLNDAKVKFVFFTLTQSASDYICAPNPVAGTCSTRDLPLDLWNALTPYGIRLCLYWPVDKFDETTSVNVVQWYSNHYGTKISAWYFDGVGGQSSTYINNLHNAAHAGNANTLVTYNTNMWTGSGNGEDIAGCEAYDLLNIATNYPPNGGTLNGEQAAMFSYIANGMAVTAITPMINLFARIRQGRATRILRLFRHYITMSLQEVQ